MVLEAIQAATSALRVESNRVSRSANNVANLNTPGFIPTRIEQADAATGGVRGIGATYMSMGPILPSESPLDMAIDGGGFFVLDDGQGGEVYSRAGNFVMNKDGALVDPMGRELVPRIEVPAEAESVSVSSTGEVSFLGADGEVLGTGQIQTASFGNPGGLAPVGGNAYQETVDSGPPVMAEPGAEGHGEMVSGALQGSGTDLAREMVNMIIGQRSFEANIKTVQTADEMLGTIFDVVG